MARIPAEEIERLKREISMVALVEARGVALEKKGADLHGRCPFHDDKTPSLVVSPKKNLWHCLGKCQAGGGVIDWVMKSEGVSFRHAVELLREGAPLGDNRAKVGTIPKLAPPVSLDADDAALFSQVVAYYHRCLLEEPSALSYVVEKRGISRAAIDHFKLGFCNRTLGLRLPHSNRAEGAAVRARLQRLGLVRESGHEHFRGRVTIPIFDESGAVVSMYGRVILHNLRAGTPDHLYLPGPHRGVFNLNGLKGARDVILCEALIDALTFWSAGFKNVTSSYGVEGFTAEILQAMKQHQVERVLVAYDRDDAGDAAAAKLIERLRGEGFSCARILFPRGMDANSYALKVQPAEKSLRLVVDKAVFEGQATSQPEPAAAAKDEVLSIPLAASSPAPSTPVTAPPPLSGPLVEVKGDDELVIAAGDRRYRVRGIKKNLSHEVLRVNLFASCGEDFHVDTLDLYSAKQRGAFLAAAARELRIDVEILRRDLGRVLLVVEEKNDEAMREVLEPKGDEAPEMTTEEREEALALLRDPNLVSRILTDFEACGVVGERTNKLVGYLAAVSRKLDDPLAIVVQSTSAAGKSALMEAVLAFVPDEEKVKYSAMTGQSLFYMGDVDLRHKVLAIVEEEGAERASYALKLLQSEKELTIASTGKDPETGKLVTHEYKVEGPVMIFLT
ncbi:MAG: DNA primase, partial [Deltaproteobacteria bacterium RBG_16_71_12]